MHVLSIVLQTLLSLLFLLTGVTKIVGAKMQVESFEQLKLPQWFRMVTGWVQIIGVIGLIAGLWNQNIAIGAGLWLAITMFGGILAHIRAQHPVKQMIPAFVLLCLALIIVFINI